MIATIRQLFQKASSSGNVINPVPAYEIWSETYDRQSGNLMLDLDEEIFTDLLNELDIKGKVLADVGCGTGRHWKKLYQKHPAFLIGFDVSAGMLTKLLQKFPEALTQLIADNSLKQVPDETIHCLVSTLTIAHIPDIEEAICAWARIMKPGGDLIITDFHPMMLALGGKRSFKHDGQRFSVVNRVHALEKLNRIFKKNNLTVVRMEVRKVDQSVKSYYKNQNALDVYDRFFGVPIIFGILLKKNSATK